MERKVRGVGGEGERASEGNLDCDKAELLMGDLVERDQDGEVCAHISETAASKLLRLFKGCVRTGKGVRSMQ